MTENNNLEPQLSSDPVDDSGETDHSTYQSIADFISDTQLMLTNTKANADILAAMVGAGYTDEEIDGKLDDLDNLRTLNENQAKEYGDQYTATNAWTQFRKNYNAIYVDHLELARIVFRRDPGAQATLGLKGERAKSQSGYINQGLLFFNNAVASASLKTALGHKGITITALQGGQAAFKTLQALKESQQKETGEAQKATQLRDELYDEISDWEMEFRATAKVVLRQSPQLMEEIGIKQVSA